MANILLASPFLLDNPLQSSDSVVSIPAFGPLCLTLSNLTSLSLVLQHFCMHQNFWASTILNSVFILWTFRPTLQNLQKLLICLMFPPSIMNLLTFSFLIVPMTSKSIWKRVLNLWLALYTLFQHLNKSLSRNSLRKISTQILSNQPHLHTVHRSYLLRRKIVHCIFVLTSTDLTTSPRRIVIHSRSSLIYWTHLAKLGSTQR